MLFLMVLVWAKDISQEKINSDRTIDKISFDGAQPMAVSFEKQLTANLINHKGKYDRKQRGEIGIFSQRTKL